MPKSSDLANLGLNGQWMNFKLMEFIFNPHIKNTKPNTPLYFKKIKLIKKKILTITIELNILIPVFLIFVFLLFLDQIFYETDWLSLVSLYMRFEYELK